MRSRINESTSSFLKATEFKYSLENFRGITIIIVMLSHLSSLSTIGDFAGVYRFIFVNATTWFVFISGYLLSHIEFNGNFEFKKYFFKKLKFVICPYLILSIPAILAALYICRPHIYDLNVFEYALWALLTGGNVVPPMWFIPMIFLFILLTPILQKIKRRLLPYITAFFLIISIFSWRPYGNLNPFLSLVHFFGFFLLGMYLHVINEKIYKMSNRSAIMLIAIGIFLFVTLYIYQGQSIEQVSYINFWYRIGELNSLQLGKLLLLISLFVFFEKFLDKKNEILSGMAKISFGLFFIHGFYMVIFSRFITPLALENSIAIGIEFMMYVPLSIISVYAIKKIFKTSSKYVIGC